MTATLGALVAEVAAVLLKAVAAAVMKLREWSHCLIVNRNRGCGVVVMVVVVEMMVVVVVRVVVVGVL